LASELAPIVLFVYNRPKHARLTIEALQKNLLVSESELFIYSDGPKRESDREVVDEIRQYLAAVDGFTRITIIKREQNMGLANSIISGVSEVLSRYGKIIVLEDDMITSPYFLRYMNEALELYEHEERVISVHGYLYPVQERLPETFFLKGADCWGWGTWKRGWDLFESDGTKLFKELKARRLEQRFDFNGTYDYIKMLKGQASGKNDSWAVRWYASALLNDRLTLFPGHSLVQNIGTDKSGIHCNETDVFRTGVALKPVYVERLMPEENNDALAIFQSYFESVRLPLHKRLLRILKEVLGGC
jgi:hypothetical protein